MTVANTHQCPQCGKATQSNLPDQVCPKCLMALAMNQAMPTTARGSGGASDSESAPPIEQLVAEFPNLEIQHLIGHGGMGAVYQARQVNLDRNVALKILSPRLSRDPAFAERFLREAQTLAKLSHNSIVAVYDFGRAGDFYYLMMEFVDGVNLRDTILANLLDPNEALAIVPQICEALQYAHDNGVVHRDIKPENILISKSGTVKIADFGLAKLLEPTAEQFTLTGTRQVLGTRNYMAPEQIETPEFVDHRADLYSLGVVFYELLTGELPLGRFSLPSEKSAAVSSGLDDVVMRTLEKDPARRYQQASQIKTACESIAPSTPANTSNEKPGRDRSPDNDGSTNSQTPICPPFPFTIQDIFASLATGYGMMRGFDTHLELEYEIRDAVVDHKWGADFVKLPLDRIAWIKLHQGLFYTHIEVQADQFESVRELPNSKRGLFRIYLKKRDRESAAQLVNYVHRYLEAKMPGNSPMPPMKASAPFQKGNSSGTLAVILAFVFGGIFLTLAFMAVAGYFWFSAIQKVPSIQEVPSVSSQSVQASDSDSSVSVESSPSNSAKASVGSSKSNSAKVASPTNSGTSVTEVDPDEQ